ILARSGEITDPCGLPVCGSDHLPSSITPAFNHFPISRRMRGSATRCSMNLIIQLLSRLWWVGTDLEVYLLCPSPLAEPVEQISRNGLPRLHSLDSRHTVGWRVETAYGNANQGWLLR